MAKSYRPWAPTQSFLLPPSPLEWLEEGHLAYFVLDVVTESLDLRAIERAIQAKDWRGERPYAPTMMVALLIYAYSVGVFSSRKMARATYEDVGFRVLAGGEHPHFTTINQFRLEHRAALAELFVQVLRLCRKAGLVKLGHVSFDGSKVAANASKHKAMSYQRMQEEEKKLSVEVDGLLKRAEETDQQEDDRYGVGTAADDLPAELRRRQDRLSRIREAKAALEREAAQARAEALRGLAEGMRTKADDETVPLKKRREAAARATHSDQQARALDDDDDDGPSGSTGADDLPRHRVPVLPDGTPKPNAQRNFTDPDSRIMMMNGAFAQAYNAQIAVDDVAQVIVAIAVTNQAPDPEHLAPMLDRVIENCDQAPHVVTADNGFLSQTGLEACARRGVNAYVSLGRELDQAAQAIGNDLSPAKQLRHAMAVKLSSEEGKRIYARRKAIVEPPLGQIKEARGFRRFSFRGLSNVRHEWSFVALTHNLLKLFRSGCTVPQPAG